MKRTEFTGDQLTQISFPLGGIGSGCIGLYGNGRLADYEIFNRPNKDTHNGDSHFAITTIKDGKIIDTRTILGDCLKDIQGTVNRGYGTGLESNTMAGFPHFKNCKFTGEFPIAHIDFEDENFNGKIHLTAWSPFIPMNDKDSSIPVAVMEYTVTNTTDTPLEYNVISCQRNPFNFSVNKFIQKDGISAIHMTQTQFDETHPDFGDFTLATDSTEDVSYCEYTFRGIWYENRIKYWKAISSETVLKNRTYDTPGGYDHCYMAVKIKLNPGESKKVRFTLTWNFPNYRCYWNPYFIETEEGQKEVTWKNYYTTLFKDSLENALYCFKNIERLRSDTMAFHDELFNVSLDETIVEAVSATLSVLRSPTVLRLENGEIWGWEGLGWNRGFCEGTCTHVWNYAYALCYLFPALERTIREWDYKYNSDPDGKMTFRKTLPLERPNYPNRACVDGQMGGIIKTYREWKMCGDKDWLLSVWDKVKQSLIYAWSDANPDKWDLNHDGVLEGRQHHTLDVELFGPSSWLEGFYALALKCAAEMADSLGDDDFSKECSSMYEKAKAYLNKELFNGKWYCQKFDIDNREYLKDYGDAYDNYFDTESNEIRYQYLDGCLLDSCLAEWHARLQGNDNLFDKDQLRISLENTYKNNFMTSMREHVNTFRLFAVNDEAGAVICTFPEGVRTPVVPIPYAEESMHGFEYAFAGLLASEGMTDKALTVVKSIRDRYRGNNRNPYNEMECGANYARSMAAFALLPLYSGYTVDNVNKTMKFSPIVNGDYRTVWFSKDSWGKYEKTDNETILTVIKGQLEINEFVLPYITSVKSVIADGKEISYNCHDNRICIDTPVNKELIIKY